MGIVSIARFHVNCIMVSPLSTKTALKPTKSGVYMK